MSKTSFKEDLEKAVAFHGHLCAGQVIGTRISRLALEHFGIEDAESYRDLVAFVEADRCLADAITSVTACHIGKRRLKWHDLGKMAACFYDIPSGKAIRIASINNEKAPEGADLVEYFEQFSDEQMFKVEDVELDIDEYDLPGRPKRSVICEQCGEKVMDNRDVEVDGQVLCKTCAGLESYYRVL
ncbi:MAG: FmdE family protein [Coriobacteriales bacterium]|jgi:formylmethanofuran dehydrogenase subunit E|nr:FmdE family protein [Coriobacteriales bacterium]